MGKAGNRFIIGPLLRRFPLTELRERERQERQHRREANKQRWLQQTFERFERARATPVKKLSGKEWIELHAAGFDPGVVIITEAARQLSAKSQTAPDCAKPLKPAARPQPLGQEAEKFHQAPP